MQRSTSLIIVSYNKRPYTALCLESLLRGEPRPDEIVAIDNGSADGSVEYLREDFPRQAATAGVAFRLIENAGNVGACTARNQGLEVASGSYLGFLDNDTAVRTRGWLAVLARTLEDEPDAGVVGPKLVYPFPPYDIEHAGAAISRNGRPKYLGRGRALDDPAHNARCEVQCLISAAWLMKREVPDQIGGLDEVFNPAQFEDFDFCYRARQHGFRVLYEPGAEMYHFENVTTDGSVDVNFRYITIKNGRTFKQRWRHAFSEEDGPADEECAWEPLPTRPLEATGVPPLV
ncbi:MAG: glycosyltransferase family 2 protein [Armatimonadetes bacterium]|nr:glycosyltransferase family 2 protein [Armatimonadota bacterium]